MANAIEQLESLSCRWDVSHGRRDRFHYHDALEEIFFHAEHRFVDYEPFAEEKGPFSERLLNWLHNVSEDADRRALFRMLNHLVYFDSKQMRSLYVQAYRSHILPWLASGNLNRDARLCPTYRNAALDLLRRHRLFSITTSFRGDYFVHLNSLQGLPKMGIFTEDPKKAALEIRNTVAGNSSYDSGPRGLIVLEDMVGSGKQVKRVLESIAPLIPQEWRCLFVPLIAQERGVRTLRGIEGGRFHISPVLLARDRLSLQRTAQENEPDDYPYFRGLVLKTASRVLQRMDVNDDVPRSEFGYGDSGTLLVTSHNCPNNTLPLLHHRAPDWAPLFRRMHHQEKK